MTGAEIRAESRQRLAEAKESSDFLPKKAEAVARSLEGSARVGPMIKENQMISAAHHRSLEEAIVDTVREPLIVLDDALRVLVASRSFYRAFDVTRQETEGRPLYELGDGEWNIPALRKLLEDIIPQHTTIEEFEIEKDFNKI